MKYRVEYCRVLKYGALCFINVKDRRLFKLVPIQCRAALMITSAVPSPSCTALNVKRSLLFFEVHIQKRILNSLADFRNVGPLIVLQDEWKSHNPELPQMPLRLLYKPLRGSPHSNQRTCKKLEMVSCFHHPRELGAFSHRSKIFQATNMQTRRTVRVFPNRSKTEYCADCVVLFLNETDYHVNGHPIILDFECFCLSIFCIKFYSAVWQTS